MSKRAAPLPDDLVARLPLAAARPVAVATEQEIHIFGDIGYEVTAAGVRQALGRIGATRDIVVRINSGGGSVFEGFAIFNALARHEGRVTVVVEALAASMASLIAMAGDEIVMPRNAFLMIHNPWSVTAGDAGAHREMAELLDKLRGPMLATYAARSGMSEDEVAAMMDDETWLAADEARERGFADRIEEPSEAKASADLSRFRNAPGALVAMAAERAPRPPRADDETRAHMRATPAPEEPIMTVKTDPAGAAPVAPVPAAATLAELKAVAARAKLGAEWIIAQQEAGATIEAARDAAIDAMAERQPAPTIRATMPSDAIDASREAAVAALVAKGEQARGGRAEVPAAVRPLMDLSILQILASYVSQQGISVSLTASPAALYHRLAEIRGMSTSDFPLVLSNAANKMMINAYNLANPTYRAIGARKVFADFKPHNFLRLGDFPVLLEKTESAEFQYGAMSEANSPVTLATFGRIVHITRRVLVNDDLSAFADLPTRAGQRVADFENMTFWSLLSQNSGAGPTIFEKNMPSGRPLFHAADHGNLTATGTVIDVTNVGIARAAMRKQTSLDGLKLNISPRYLVTGPDRETVADQFTNGTTFPATDGAVNPFRGRLEPISDANLTGNAWYLFADPAQIETLVYGYLRGAEGPQIAVRDGFTTDGMEMRVFIDFATGGVDYRGAFKNNGA